MAKRRRNDWQDDCEPLTDDQWNETLRLAREAMAKRSEAPAPNVEPEQKG